jgi:hypothetical protein
MIETLLLALLCFFVSASIFYEVDGGLKASHICINEGETSNCFNALRDSK